MKIHFLLAIAGLMFLLFSCKKKDLELDGDLDPVCNLEYFEIEPSQRLSNEEGRVVEIVRVSLPSLVRIQLDGADRRLDPCNLPQGIPVGSKIRFSGILYHIKNAENLNLDFFPIGLSKVEVIDSGSE